MIEYRIAAFLIILVAMGVVAGALTSKRHSTYMIGLMLAAALVVTDLAVFVPLVLETCKC